MNNGNLLVHLQRNPSKLHIVSPIAVVCRRQSGQLRKGQPVHEGGVRHLQRREEALEDDILPRSIVRHRLDDETGGYIEQVAVDVLPAERFGSGKETCSTV